jgi:ligand-binding sensor domain-containing protein
MRRNVTWTLVAGMVLLGSAAAFWVSRAQHAIDEARAAAAASSIPFQIRPLSESKPAVVEFLPSPPDFRDAVLFHDLLYLCGSGGIWAYDLNGDLRATYLTGRDLPASPPVAMAVGTVAGDAKPRLWIGTASAGILNFDGYQFSQLQFQHKGYGNITSLLMLPSGILLAGFSEAGMIAYNGSAINPFHNGLRNIPVTALASGGEGDVWIGTRDRGLIHWSGGSTETFSADTGLPDNGVISIVATAERVFAGTAVGIAEFRDGKFVRNIAEGVFARTLLIIKDSLLIGTVDEGILTVSLNTNARKSPGLTPVSDPDPLAARKLVEISGVAYALTASGLHERQTSNSVWIRRISTAAETWTDRNISAISSDAEGKLWVGYFDRGLDIISSDGLKLARHLEDDQVFCVNRIVPDPRRNMQIVATANGMILVSLQGTILKRVSKADGLISEHVTDVSVQPNGLAIATASGVTLIDAAGPQSIYAFHGLASNHVYALGGGGARLLAGTLGGLSIIQDGFVRASYTTANSLLKQNWISSIVSDADGWYIGTYGSGVFHMDHDGHFTEFPDIPANTVINPNAMLAAGGRVFAGTLDRGLLAYDPADNRWAPVNNALPSMNVTALGSSSGNLLVGTDNGIVRMPIEGVFR